MRRASTPLPCTAIAFLLLLASVACGHRHAATAMEGWVAKPVQYAQFFQLWERGADRLLITFGPGGREDTTGLFVVAQDKAAHGLPHGAVPLPHVLQHVALMSTTHASFIAALGCADAVEGCAHTDRLRDPQVAARAQNGMLKEIATADGLDRERILMLDPDALFTYPYGNEAGMGAIGNLPVIPIAEYLEKHPLGRAEWIRAFGMLFGKEGLADSLFANMAARYQAARGRVPEDAPRPSVFFGSSWKGTWSVPAGNSYMAQLVHDAGGSYLFADRTADGNIDLDLETTIKAGSKARFWGRVLDQPHPVTVEDVAGHDGRIADLPAFQEHGAFYANSMASDVFGQAGLEPDLVLLDLIGIFHPELRQGREPVYFRLVQ